MRYYTHTKVYNALKTEERTTGTASCGLRSAEAPVVQRMESYLLEYGGMLNWTYVSNAPWYAEVTRKGTCS